MDRPRGHDPSSQVLEDGTCDRILRQDMGLGGRTQGCSWFDDGQGHVHVRIPLCVVPVDTIGGR